MNPDPRGFAFIFELGFRKNKKGKFHRKKTLFSTVLPEPEFLAGAGAGFSTRLRIKDIYYILAEKKCQLHEQSQEKG